MCDPVAGMGSFPLFYLAVWWDIEGAVQSVALSGTMFWNSNSNNNNSHVKKGPPPDEAVDVGVKHSSEAYNTSEQDTTAS